MSKTCETQTWTFRPHWAVTRNGPFIDAPTLQPDTETIRQTLQRQKRTEDSNRNTLHMLQTFIWLICEANVRVSPPVGRCRLLFESLSQHYLQKTWATLITQKSNNHPELLQYHPRVNVSHLEMSYSARGGDSTGGASAWHDRAQIINLTAQVKYQRALEEPLAPPPQTVSVPHRVIVSGLPVMCLRGGVVVLCGLTGGWAVCHTLVFSNPKISGAVDSHTHTHPFSPPSAQRHRH